MHRFYKKHHRAPKRTELKMSRDVYRSHYGSYTNAVLELLGEHTQKYKYTKDEMLEHIKNYVNKYGKVPKLEDFRRAENRPCARTYVNIFGSWQNVITEAGYTYHRADEEFITCLKCGELIHKAKFRGNVCIYCKREEIKKQKELKKLKKQETYTKAGECLLNDG